MWALRRASNPLKYREIRLGSFRAGCARVESGSCYLKNENESAECAPGMSDQFVPSRRYHHNKSESFKFYNGRHYFSSHAGMKSSEDEDDLEDGFSELERTASANEIEARSDNELISESEISDGDSDDEVSGLKNELELSDTAAEVSKENVEPKRHVNRLLRAILNAPGLSIKSVLDKWVEDGNEVNKTDIMVVNSSLRRRKMFGRALQMLEWSADHHEWSERDYASRVDMIAKVQGLEKAEKFIEKIPKAYRGEVVYRTLLANCVTPQNIRKANEVFNKMKSLEFPITAFAYNQLLLLYKRTDRKKIADLLIQMEKDNVKPNVFTYNLLIDTKGQSKDITGMDQIVETMKEEGVEPNDETRNIMAMHYISAKFKDKAKAIMKEMEGGDACENRPACRYLLVLYGLLGNADEVSRIWEICESDANIIECLSAIEAWGKLNKIKEAEEVLEKMNARWKRPSPKVYSTLLKVYADHKMLAEGIDLVKRMAEGGCRIGPQTCDALVKLHVEAGEVEKADAILQKVTQQKQMKPMFNSFITIMEQYSKKGDVHNAEKMFYRMQQAGYAARTRQFQVLVKAYVIGKSPAYGMNQRMKADNIFPNYQLVEMLKQVDPFKKTAASDLLD
ncbi:hypothetical protein ACET3Z_023538 [Daucus carota]